MPRVIVPATSLTPPRASLTTALTGSNNDLVFTAAFGGPGGNNLQIQYVNPGAPSQALSVARQGNLIVVNLATDGSSVITTTAAQVAAAVTGTVSSLVSVANAPANDGTGLVIALAATSLAGGSLQTSPPSQVNGDSTNNHYFTGNDGLTFIEVVSSDAGVQTVTILYNYLYAPIENQVSQAESIPAGATRLLGPFSNGAFDQNSTSDVYFNTSVSTTLKFRVYKTVKQT